MSGYAVAYLTGSPWAGVLAAALAGALFGLIHGVICSIPKVNDIAIGIAMMLLGMGLAFFFGKPFIQPVAPDLPAIALRPADGWCDDAGAPNYNRLVTLPCRGSHERLWRDDRLYDLIVELGYNDDPPEPGKGSAIFLHIARADYLPTEGCVALAEADLRAVLARLSAGSVVEIRA